jgi:hypothetical protein
MKIQKTDTAVVFIDLQNDVLSEKGANSGADWLDRFKPYIEDGRTIVVSPHKVWGLRPTI